METESFYATLPSNVPYANRVNTCASYTTQLPERLRLPGKWKVALTEISYTFSWWNVPNGSKLHLFEGRGAQATTMPTGGARIAPGFYRKFDVFKSEANKAIASALELKKNDINLPQVTIDPVDLQVVFKAGATIVKPKGNRPFHYYFHFDDELMSMLGFDKDNRVYKPGEDGEFQLKANQAYDLSGGIHALYVEMDIIRPVLIGNTYANVLKIVEVPPIESEFGQQITV